jgi:hypothetical protein
LKRERHVLPMLQGHRSLVGIDPAKRLVDIGNDSCYIRIRRQ